MLGVVDVEAGGGVGVDDEAAHGRNFKGGGTKGEGGLKKYMWFGSVVRKGRSMVEGVEVGGHFEVSFYCCKFELMNKREQRYCFGEGRKVCRIQSDMMIQAQSDWHSLMVDRNY